MDQTKSVCPACGSTRTVPATRDAPGIDLAELEREHWLILAGGPVGEDDPDWHCHACGYEWIESTNSPA